jgi:hypothetical protein
VSDEGNGQAKTGKNGFDVWSTDEPASETPKNGPVPGKSNTYEWTDDLSEGGPNGATIGTAEFSGTMEDNEKLDCGGSIHLTGGSGWTGRVRVSGTLQLQDGKVGFGHLAVDDGQDVPFQRVHVTKENPKRYKTV